MLFTTRPSWIGLCTTVGLGQGAFDIYGAGKGEEAVNAFGNRGPGRRSEPAQQRARVL